MSKTSKAIKELEEQIHNLREYQRKTLEWIDQSNTYENEYEETIIEGYLDNNSILFKINSRNHTKQSWSLGCMHLNIHCYELKAKNENDAKKEALFVVLNKVKELKILLEKCIDDQ